MTVLCKCDKCGYEWVGDEFDCCPDCGFEDIWHEDLEHYQP